MFTQRNTRDVLRKKRGRRQILLGCGLFTILVVLGLFSWMTTEDTQTQTVKEVPHPQQTQKPSENQEQEVEVPDNQPPPPAQNPDTFDPYSVKIPHVVVQPSPTEDPEVRRKREAIKAAFVHAYGGYEKLCMGQGELHPITGKCNNWLVANMGLSIMDSLDTMLIMGLDDHYKRGRDFLAEHLNWNQTINVSVFETNIRCLGGLLTAYAFTKDPVMLQKAIELGDHLLPAFDSPTGYPYTWINLQTKETSLSKWTGGSVILSELGTMQLEFEYLSIVSGNPIYGEKALKVFERLYTNMPADKLYPLMMNIQNGQYTTDLVGVGALGDSFYEYILKLWLLNKRSEDVMGKWYFEEAEAIIDHLGVWIDESNFLIGERQYGGLKWKMDHLACFAGAMFGLGAKYAPTSVMAQKHMKHAIGVGNFCKEMYAMNPTGLPCDSVRVNEKSKKIDPADFDTGVSYQMRPEAVETWFYLYRLTNDTKYQDWGWEFFQSIEKYTKTKLGYTGVRDATRDPEDLEPDDKQQSFFLAETLKYLYLLFSPHDYIPLDEFVFNTEAHPFPMY